MVTKCATHRPIIESHVTAVSTGPGSDATDVYSITALAPRRNEPRKKLSVKFPDT